MSFVKLREDAKEAEKTQGTQPPLHTVTGATGKPEAYLGRGTKVVGTLSFSGSTEIDCHVEGEINSKETLVISEGAVVNGKIFGGEITVRGTVNGDIVASKRLSLKRPAKIVGNISASNLSIEEGVVFEGKCAMTADSSKSGVKAPGSDATVKSGVAA